jgi:3-oxoacyl-[acyl-carrier protein] reductase
MPRTILVTGGTGAIASALISALTAAGDDVVSVDRLEPEPRDRVQSKVCDLARLEEIDELAASLRRDGVTLDGIVHCAGVIHTHVLDEEPREAWLRVLQINLVAPIALTQVLSPFVNRGGSIVFITTGLVYKGVPRSAVYTATKAGLIGLARTIATEYGDREIRVNTVAPGLVATPLTPDYDDREPGQLASRALKRRETAQDVVGAIEFFLSPASAFITGQTLVVDGGSVRH